MHLNVIQLQAAMGLGLLLMAGLGVLIFIAFPVLVIVMSIQKIIARRNTNRLPISKKEYLIIIFNQFLLSLTIIVAIIVVVFLFVYFFVDLSIS